MPSYSAPWPMYAKMTTVFAGPMPASVPRNSRRSFFIRFFVTMPSGAVVSMSSKTWKPMVVSSSAKSSASWSVLSSGLMYL